MKEFLDGKINFLAYKMCDSPEDSCNRIRLHSLESNEDFGFKSFSVFANPGFDNKIKEWWKTT